MKVKVYLSITPSPLGQLTIGATNKGVCLLEFDKKERIENHFKQFEKYWDYSVVKQENKWIKVAKKQLEEYFSHQRTTFDLPLDLTGTDFQLSVWNELLTIPFGTTRSYKEQAIAVGNLKAIRAVATANGENRISIIIPCHRVVGSNGSLTGYGGGIERKQQLLDLESDQMTLF